jgi:hypothetical protein
MQLVENAIMPLSEHFPHTQSFQTGSLAEDNHRPYRRTRNPAPRYQPYPTTSPVRSQMQNSQNSQSSNVFGECK